jgi:anti-sigma regulatory factor (Ser/Thr protein kinase)
MKADLTPDGDKIEICIPCKPEFVGAVRRAIAEFASLLDIPISDVEEIEIAASEAVSNVIRHAYTNITNVPPLRIKCAHRLNGFTVEVIDKGCGFNAPSRDEIPQVDLDREGGLGIILIKSFMDRVHFISKPGRGTRIRMVKRSHKTVPNIGKVSKLSVDDFASIKATKSN